MAKVLCRGKEIEVDEDGFIKNPELWDKEIALSLAKAEGVHEMSEQHWKIVNYLRDYYKKFGIAPMARKLCKDCNVTLKEIYELFPSGPIKGACRVAGLPKPTGCV